MFLVLAVAMINDLIGDDLIDFDLILLIDLNPFNKRVRKKEMSSERESEHGEREREHPHSHVHIRVWRARHPTHAKHTMHATQSIQSML